MKWCKKIERLDVLPHREEEVEEEEGVLDTLDACLHPDLSNLIIPLASQHYSHTGAAQPPAQPPHRWGEGGQVLCLDNRGDTCAVLG